MRSDLIPYKIPYGTHKWYAFRKSGIGGSEVAQCMGLNPYGSRVRLFYEKIGRVEARRDTNQFMFWGQRHESTIRDMWQYWDGNYESYIENFEAERVIRKCKNINAYIVNPEYPWLFASLDSLINIKGGTNLITGEPLLKEAILECKTLTFNAAKMWEDGLPIYYVFQIQMYMIVMGVDYAEIAVLQDGNKFEVIPFEKDQEICNRIIEETYKFWYQKVLPAKEAVKASELFDQEKKYQEAEDQEALLQQLEPDPDNVEDYQQFLSEVYTREYSSVPGPDSLLNFCQKDELAKIIMKKLGQRRTKFRNTLAQYIVAHKTEKVDFGGAGHILYYLKTGDRKHTMRSNLKIKPTDEFVNKIMSKLDF